MEVAPAYDHAGIRSVAASHLAYDVVNLTASKEGA